MNISCINEENTSLISVVGRIDATTSADFESQCFELVNDANKNVALDLTALDYISSAGLRSILKLAKICKEKKLKLALFGLQKAVAEVFKISGFNTIIKICDDKESALKTVSVA